MLIKENKKRKVFSKKRDIDAYKFDLEPEYLGLKEYLGVSDTASNGSQKVHRFNIKLPIDRLAAVKNEVAYIEAYLVQDIVTAKSRKKMYSGFNQNKISNINFAIVNKEILARNEMKSKDAAASMYSLFSIGIVHSVLLGLTKEKIKNIPESKVFGFEEVIETYKLVNQNTPNQNNLDIEYTNFNDNIRNNKSFKPLNFKIYKQNVEPTNSQVFKRDYLKTRAAGIDPAVIINSGKYNTQSLVDTIKGRLPQDFSYKKQTQLLKNYNNIIESKIVNNKKTVTIIKKKRSKQHQVFEKIIEITEETLAKFNFNISLVVYAKNKNKRKIDSYFLDYAFNDLEAKYLLARALDAYSFLGINSTRRNNKIVISMSNKSKNEVTFDIKRALVKNYSDIHNIRFKDYMVKKIGPNTYQRATKSKDSCLKSQAMFYRSNFKIAGFKIDNTVFMHNPPVAMNANNLAPEVGISAQNATTNSVDLIVTNIPGTALGINVIKRNVSKKERKYKLIKTLNNPENSSVISLSDHRPNLFRNYQNKSLEINFIDDDVEESSVYEYKVISYMDNGEILESCNSLVHMFEKKRELIKVELVTSFNESTSKQIEDEQSVKMGFRFKVTVEKNAILEMFESLDRNTYELLSAELDDVKNSLTQNISCIAYLENISKTTSKEIQRITTDKEGVFDIFFNLENIFDKQNLVIEPRMKTSTGLIDNILEKIETLPNTDRNNLNPSFLKNLRTFRQKSKNLEGKDYISKIGEKYTSRSVKLLGTIIDPATKFAIERSDFYYDGRTGDTISIRLPTDQLINRIGALSFVNFAASHDRSNNKIKMLINMKSRSAEFIDFYSIYTLSNGSLSFKGLMTASDEYQDNYSFYLDLKNEVGLVEIYTAAITKDGSIISPTQLTGFIVDKNKIRRV